ncbi:MAG: 3-isopropylmalate dehydratase small subunit [Deltaproteobacteria bacterium]|nr:3-isopropylmalate dehydratase small subunit [Deltaproteobacteria bacterium]MBW2022107.1 3-isopropylmalate dehydratase small subunit [Deltaproteobacteria bacterium]MBW2045225.1 3-isopropylmalate dehydratase small subunit [Deltaproteobacteria bacterium]MBW2300205.1 3-isopropylmalate dehydratase small subunit [Deltaproteobacteria bacterium]
MICKGRAWKFGKDINTDVILPTKYMNLRESKELAKHCLENQNPQFAKEAKEGDIIVADKNFGCGSSREHAPISIKGKGIGCVIARSFARIFYRSAFNIGLPILESGAAVDGIEDGHELEVDLATGEIKNRTTGESFNATPIPAFMQEIIDDGGLMGHIKKKLKT